MNMTPQRPNEVWAYDFIFDSCVNGETLKCPTLVDEFTREAVAVDVAGSIRSRRVIEVLQRLTRERGAPLFLRSDNGPEFVAAAVKEWLFVQKVQTVFIEPGKPWQDARNESFNGRFRDECLNQEWFYSRLEATVIVEDLRRMYNTIRPHSSLNQKTPVEFLNEFGNNIEPVRLTI